MAAGEVKEDLDRCGELDGERDGELDGEPDGAGEVEGTPDGGWGGRRRPRWRRGDLGRLDTQRGDRRIARERVLLVDLDYAAIISGSRNVDDHCKPLDGCVLTTEHCA
jgi:hypothetical protein